MLCQSCLRAAAKLLFEGQLVAALVNTRTNQDIHDA